jgi:ATP-dependent Lhr-like helicase
LPAATTAGETPALQLAERATERVERLLRRHGFACRELADGAVDGTWRSCYEVLTRMEWAGTIRRGYFVEGITGSQFAVPGIQLDAGVRAGEGVVWLAMLDPANLYGHLETRWVSDVGQPARVPRTAGSWLALIGGRPVLAAVSYGQRLIPLSADAGEQQLAVEALGELVGRLPDAHRTLTVRFWGPAIAEEADVSILESPMAEVLKGVGFVRDTQSMRLYRSYAGAG